MTWAKYDKYLTYADETSSLEQAGEGGYGHS